MKKAWAWIAGVFAALTALFYFWLESGHRKKQKALVQKIGTASKNKKHHFTRAKDVEDEINALRNKAREAEKKGKAKLEEIKNDNSSLAARVDAYARRRRLRNRKPPGSRD